MGPDNPNYVHGKYSKNPAIPVHVLELYHASLADPALLSLRDEVAMLDARMAQVLGRLGSGESGAGWKQAKQKLADYRRAAAKGQEGLADASKAFGELQAIINQGVSDERIWDEYSRLTEQRRKLVESERKRLMEAGMMLTVEQAYYLISNLSAILKERIPDAGLRAEIQRDIVATANALPSQ